MFEAIPLGRCYEIQSIGHLLMSARVSGRCKNIDCARHLINRLMYESLPPSELLVRMLIQASRHDERKPEVKTAVKQLQIPKTDETVCKALDVLCKELGV